MLDIKIDPTIETKLRSRHSVEPEEVAECFANVTLGFLEDTRESHKTNPPTYWFIEQTDTGRKLFVAFMQIDEEIVIKTAFDADQKRINVYTSLVGK